jgi:urea transport system ATP-binding protein
MSDTTHSLLYLSGVSVSFDGFKALNNLALDIRHGEMRAIIGPNGAGKTTMMDVITGKTKPDEGEVMFDRTTDLTRLDEAAIANLGIGRKFQKPTVFEFLSVEDNLLLALKGRRTVGANLFWRRNNADATRLDAVLGTIRLGGHRDRLAGSLAHGQKQWLEMTDSETETTADLLREIAETHAIVVVEHDMEFVRRLGVRVTCLHEGSVLAEGNLDQVSANERVIEVYLGR